MLHIILRVKPIGTILILLSCVLWLNACGNGDDGGIGERLSGPEAVSALPMRIDATITPTGTATPLENKGTPLSEESPPLPPETDDSAAEEDEPSVLEARLKLLPPPPLELPGQTTSTPSVANLATTKVTITPTMSINPTPSPKPTATPEPEPTSDTRTQADPTAAASDAQENAPQKDASKASLATEKKPAADSLKKKPEATSRKSTEKKVSADIKLDRLVVCSALSNRTPSGVAEQFSFSDVKKVYTWMKVSGAKPPMQLKHRYYREGKFVASVSLKIKYPSMRTWSQKSFKGPESQGKWKVVVTTENEDVILAEREFTLLP